MPKTKRTAKLSITLPRELASEIRQLVAQGEISAFFAEAARQSLARRQFRKAMEQGFGAWSSERHPELATLEDSTAFVRSLRQAGQSRVPTSAGNSDD